MAQPSGTIPPAALYVLLALGDGERHGYAIIKEIETVTQGALSILPGTLYRIVKQLVDDGWIAEAGGTQAKDERRRYYRLTARGRKAAQAEVARMAMIVSLARARRLFPSGATL
jgi:DNA-binding PadR family transcriptional regulator